MEALGVQLRAEAVLESLTEEVIKSSEIEGEVLENAQVRSSIARRLGLDIGALAPVDRTVEGVVEMMLDATQRYDQLLKEQRLFGWHAALFPTGRSGMTRITIGAWPADKSAPMQVVSSPIGPKKLHYGAPAASRFKGEIRTFLTWCNAAPRVGPVLKAAVAHLWFVTVHPFEDGDGRIARAIADLALARSRGKPAALLQHCPRRSTPSERAITTFWRRPSKATSTSPLGCNGFWRSWIARSAARTSRWLPF